MQADINQNAIAVTLFSIIWFGLQIRLVIWDSGKRKTEGQLTLLTKGGGADLPLSSLIKEKNNPGS